MTRAFLGMGSNLGDRRARLAEAASPGTTAAASAWNGHLAVRALGDAVGPLRGLVARFLAGYRALPMPRVWQS